MKVQTKWFGEIEVSDDKIMLILNCMCEDGPVDTFKISYDIDRG